MRDFSISFNACQTDLSTLGGFKIITKALLLSRLHMEFYRHRVKVGKKLLSCAYNIFQGMGILDHDGSDYNMSGQNRSLQARKCKSGFRSTSVIRIMFRFVCVYTR